MTPESDRSGYLALEEFHALLRDSCGDQPQARPLAVRYQICRSDLMKEEFRSHLPGFVRQCVSLLKFREFIHLYHHDVAARLRFVDSSLEPCRRGLKSVAVGAGGTTSIIATPEARSGHEDMTAPITTAPEAFDDDFMDDPLDAPGDDPLWNSTGNTDTARPNSAAGAIPETHWPIPRARRGVV